MATKNGSLPLHLAVENQAGVE
eukprot:COSAG05_NODE_19157_length_297_cov_0.328283_1_plen_21_part_10